MMRVSLYASEVAACINYNKYQLPAEAAKKIWGRIQPNTLASALERNRVLVKTVEDTILDHNIETIITEIVNSDNVQEAQTTLDSVVSILSPDEAHEVRSHVNTERGTRQEHEGIEQYVVTERKTVQQRNTTSYKLGIPYSKGKTFYLYGRVDGINEDNEIVEIKCRQRRIFNYVPLYEKVQLHVYMALTNIKVCHLVQKYNTQLKTTIVYFDQDFWNDVLIRLTDFVKHLTETLGDETKQDQLVQGHF